MTKSFLRQLTKTACRQYFRMKEESRRDLSRKVEIGMGSALLSASVATVDKEDWFRAMNRPSQISPERQKVYLNSIERAE